MSVKREHIVLIASVLLVGWLVRGSFESDGGSKRRSRRSSRTAGELEFVHHPAPAVDVVLPAARDLSGLERDLFSEPSDSRPLPPLEFVVPPLPELSALRPPPVPGPSPAYYGRFLRADAAPTVEPVPGLFISSETAPAVASLVGELEDLAGSAQEDPAARSETWMGLYDWIRIHSGLPLFGHIRNNDRYGLPLRAPDAILFVEVDPTTGEEKFPGQDPVPFARERVIEFGFANTPANKVGLRTREIGETITPGQYLEVIEFADWCVDHHREAEGALVAAARMYQLADSVSPDDPEPRLGLARCYEAGFQFEKAFLEYRSLLEEFSHRPEVYVRLARLEERFRLFELAEEHLLLAEQKGRSSHEVQHAFGRFLLDRGRGDEALEHLQLAFRFEPDPKYRSERVAIRVDLGAALLRAGRLDESLGLFEKALQVDPTDPGARAAHAAGLILGAGGGAEAVSLSGANGFEELLASGLAALERKEWLAAQRDLTAAAGADPLRSWQAWRALSWLAEITGYAEEAAAWVEQAHESNPTDPYTLYQHGRLLARRDEFESASDSFQRALDQELDFVDALVAKGALLRARGEHEAAERYFERALQLDSERAEVHALRGVNLIELGDLRAAESSARIAMDLDGADPVARSVAAWCTYRRSGHEKALQLFADLDDNRRGLSEEDVHRLYAQKQIGRLGDHMEKVVWSDRFDRRNLRNDWSVGGESAGPKVSLVDGQVVVSGTFTQNGVTRVYRSYAAPVFVSIEADLTIREGGRARVGLFLSKERRGRGGASEVLDEISVSRHRDGNVQTRHQRRGESEAVHEDHPAFDWAVGQTIRLRIERLGQGSDAVGRILLDGVPILEGFSMRSFSTSSGTLRVGAFAEGEVGRNANLTVDDVEVVFRVRS